MILLRAYFSPVCTLRSVRVRCDVCQAVVPYCAKDTARCHRGLPYGNERHTFTGTWT